MAKLIGCVCVCIMLAAVALIGVALVTRGGNGERKGGNEVVVKAPQPRADAATQAEREKLLDGWMVPGGPLAKMDGGRVAKLWVRPAFYALEFDDKRRVVGVAYAFAFSIHPTATLSQEENGMEQLWLIDSLSGKRVGTFTYTGLRMD